MSTSLAKWITAGALCGALVAAGLPARAYDDGSTGTSLTIVPVVPPGDGAASDEAPVKPRKKSTARATARSADTSATAAPSTSAATSPAAAVVTGPAASLAASGAAAATGPQPATATGTVTATSGTAIQPLAPIQLPTPEPSPLSTPPVWPRPDAERRAAASSPSTASPFGLGQPIDLTRTLARGGATLGAMLVVGGLALVWARSRRGAAASAETSRDRLTVVSSRALAPRRSVHLVEVDGVRILVGLDAERIVPLALVPAPPRPAEAAATATATARSSARPASQTAPAAAAQRPAPPPVVPLIDEKHPVTVDVPELVARAARTSATRAPDPAALLSLTNSLKRHLRNRANGSGNGNGSVA